MQASEIAQRLGCKRTRLGQRKFRVKCPAHGSNGLTLCVYQDNDKVGLTCFAGCRGEDILACVGLKLRDLFNNPMSPETKAHLTAEQELERLRKVIGLSMWLQVVGNRRYYEAVERNAKVDYRRLWPSVCPEAAYRLKRRRERLQHAKTVGLDAYFDELIQAVQSNPEPQESYPELR